MRRKKTKKVWEVLLTILLFSVGSIDLLPICRSRLPSESSLCGGTSKDSISDAQLMVLTKFLTIDCWTYSTTAVWITSAPTCR